jgi:hypothetical protein
MSNWIFKAKRKQGNYFVVDIFNKMRLYSYVPAKILCFSSTYNIRSMISYVCVCLIKEVQGNSYDWKFV